MSWTPIPQAETPGVLRLEAKARAAAEVELFTMPGIVWMCSLCAQYNTNDSREFRRHLSHE